MNIYKLRKCEKKLTFSYAEVFFLKNKKSSFKIAFSQIFAYYKKYSKYIKIYLNRKIYSIIIYTKWKL